LNKEQTESIVECHFYLKKIIGIYFNCEEYSQTEYEYIGDDPLLSRYLVDDDDAPYIPSDDYFIDHMNTSMLYFLNDNKNYTW
jgi:hypothetical protein